MLGYSAELNEYFIYYGFHKKDLRYEPEKKRVYVDNYYGIGVTTGGKLTKKDIHINSINDIYRISGTLNGIKDETIVRTYTQDDIDSLTPDLTHALIKAKL